MHPVATFIRDLHTIRATGLALKETSFYGPLQNLLNEIGAALRPRVRAVNFLKNQGAGIPDFGLFTADQLQKAVGDPLPGTLPSRGVVEVKAPGEPVATTVRSEQVLRYLQRYGLVLVTNYREWALVAPGPRNQPHVLESYSLAPDEASFWQAAADPAACAAAHGARLVEYLRRVLLQAAPLADPQDVAWFLASYARDARARVEQVDAPALDAVRSALEEALGIRFEGRRGDHFFRSTLVQTLFYGIFSAWVLWHDEQPDRVDRFDWRLAPYYLHVPIIQALFEQVSGPSRLRPLGLMEVLDWTGAALNRVTREAFFRKFDQGQAVQYFYEPFLQAFDPELRKELGVWYTPAEIIRYQVARVDTVLRDDLGIADGLADPSVYVLDPCCGTGAYLVEVLRHVEATLRARGDDALLGADLKRAATARVFGFELLPAPFVIAHLQLGLFLQQHGARLDDTRGERAAVFLTNALTGWTPPTSPKQHLIFPELEAERDAAERVKQETPILVILGNPPYNGFAGLAVAEERDLSTAYRTTKRAPAPQGQGLNDLYVRFFRMAERRIIEGTGRGVVCFISNYSWLDGLSFTGMRERYLDVFDRIWIDSLNGDKYKTGKLTPEGLPDPSVFSTDFNPEGIQVGTAIALLVRSDRHKPAHPAANPSQPVSTGFAYQTPNSFGGPSGGPAVVHFRQLWGKTKRAQLLAAAHADPDQLYITEQPALALGLPFMPASVEANYLDWPLLPDLFPVSFPGVKTSRDDVVVDIDRERLVARMRQYFDPAISHEQMRWIAPGAMESTARFNAESVRDYLRKRGFLPSSIVRYAYRPFDVRWLYWEPETKLLDEKRSEYVPHVFDGNLWIEARQRQPMERFDRGFVVRVLADNLGNGLSSYFPLYLKTDALERSLFTDRAPNTTQPNLSQQATAYIVEQGATAEDLFLHTLAILHAPAYRAENAGALRQDWPRIPLPASKAALLQSAALGWQVAALLDTEQAVPGVTAGPIREELRAIGIPAAVGGRQLSVEGGDTELRAGWGHAGKGGVTMPGKGRVVERAYTAEERAAIEAGAAALGLSPETAFARLGAATRDIYLNDRAFWSNMPAQVWEYTIGGYQVIKKWLSYREHALLGRALTVDEVREVQQMARRIAALLLLQPALDANYAAVKAACSSGRRG